MQTLRKSFPQVILSGMIVYLKDGAMLMKKNILTVLSALESILGILFIFVLFI